MSEQITLFTRQAVKLISDELDKALEGIREQYGLRELQVESVHFFPDSMTMKIKGTAVPGKDSYVTDYREAEQRFFLQHNELPETMMAMEFLWGGRLFKVDRIETRNPKYPILATCLDDGKTYKFSVEQVKRVIQATKDLGIK